MSSATSTTDVGGENGAPGRSGYFRELSALPTDWTSMSAAFVRQARASWSKVAVADSNGTSLTYGEALTRAAVLGRVLARTCGDATHVGIMVPPTVPAVVTNLAVMLWRKVTVNLNYTASQEMIDSSISQCGITHVITSRKVIEKFKIVPKAEIIYLEDLPAKVGWADKLWRGWFRMRSCDGFCRGWV
jgi:acyl-[acyl-carrier-protein]-phospholipid O-acyltransferase/long-chain-fatty-acid--[acyl-carrier-protein] ligase